MLRQIVLFLALPLTATAAVNYTYDDAGRLATVDYGDGRTIVYTYDPAGNLLSRTMTSANGSSSSDKPTSKAKEKDTTRTPGTGGKTRGLPLPTNICMVEIALYRIGGSRPSAAVR